MEIITWNVRSLGKKEKKKPNKKVEILSAQETKQKSMTKETINSILGHSEMEHIEVDAEGTAGRILTIWNPEIFKVWSKSTNTNQVWVILNMLLSGVL